MRTLIVDDDYTSRQLLNSYLKGLSECEQARDGAEAIQRFIAAHEAKRPFHLICLDMMMPGMTGQETLRAIRAWEQDHKLLGRDGVKILMTTIVDDFEEVLQSFRDQCEGYLVKPFAKKALDEQLALLELN